MKYHFKVHKDGKGFWAECLEIEGCLTQGENKEHLSAMMKDALEAILSAPEDSKWILPLANPALGGKNVVEVSPDPGIALAALLRRHRLVNHLTQRQAQARLELKNLIQYQRLEMGSSNPELKTLAKIKEAFPDFSVDAVLA